jgi:hypothetical protein
MILLTVDKFPDEYKIVKLHGMIQTVFSFESNSRGVIPSRLSRFALEEFTGTAADISGGEANAVYGITVTPLDEGNVLYTGTAVTVESVD